MTECYRYYGQMGQGFICLLGMAWRNVALQPVGMEKGEAYEEE